MMFSRVWTVLYATAGPADLLRSSWTSRTLARPRTQRIFRISSSRSVTIWTLRTAFSFRNEANDRDTPRNVTRRLTLGNPKLLGFAPRVPGPGTPFRDTTTRPPRAAAPAVRGTA